MRLPNSSLPMRLISAQSTTYALVSVDRSSSTGFVVPFESNAPLEMELPAHEESVWQQFLILMLEDRDGDSWENDQINVVSEVELKLDFVERHGTDEASSDTASSPSPSPSPNPPVQASEDHEKQGESSQGREDVTKSGQNYSVVILGIGGALTVVVVTLVLLVCVYLRRKQRTKSRHKNSKESGESPAKDTNAAQKESER